MNNFPKTISEYSFLYVWKLSRIAFFDKLSEQQLQEIDNLAKLMQYPDKNFEDLQKIWNSNKEFRLVKGGLI